MSPKLIVNGIDVGDQRAAADPLRGRAALTTSTEWLGGTQTRTLATAGVLDDAGREFTIDTDYPYELFGSGIAPSPHQLLMAALGASFVAAFILAAAAADIRVEGMRVLTATSEGIGSGGGPAAPASLELRAEVDADVTPARLEQLVATATERSLIAGLSGQNIRVSLAHVDGTKR